VSNKDPLPTFDFEKLPDDHEPDDHHVGVRMIYALMAILVIVWVIGAVWTTAPVGGK
jgi:hypothetical protein